MEPEKCRRCKGVELVIIRASEKSCSDCGLVIEERMVDEGAEYRCFSGDQGDVTRSEKRKRVRRSYNPLNEHSLLDNDPEMKFFEDGKKCLDNAIDEFYHGNGEPVKRLAFPIYQQLYRAMKLQKKEGIRQKYSRRKQMIVAAIYKALIDYENNHTYIKRLVPIQPEQISHHVEGELIVTMSLVKKVLEDLGDETSQQGVVIKRQRKKRSLLKYK
ncbi:MAG: hypothetical protein OEL89_05485 [Candidatus Peregrinibacteria bacterium]|nr:hypothetical protein [Candidatus Peregrinibacteria bacterium]